MVFGRLLALRSPQIPMIRVTLLMLSCSRQLQPLSLKFEPPLHCTIEALKVE